MLFILQLAHHFGFCDQQAVDGRAPRHLGHGTFAPDHCHLDTKLIAWHHGPPELRGIDRDQQHQLVIAIRNALENQHARRLRHGFHDQDAGHNRKLRKVPVEKRLVDGDILDADNPFRLEFEDAIDKQERVAMRQDLPDLIDIQNGHGN